jgi:hypothetical protein
VQCFHRANQDVFLRLKLSSAANGIGFATLNCNLKNIPFPLIIPAESAAAFVLILHRSFGMSASVALRFISALDLLHNWQEFRLFKESKTHIHPKIQAKTHKRREAFQPPSFS